MRKELRLATGLVGICLPFWVLGVAILGGLAYLGYRFFSRVVTPADGAGVAAQLTFLQLVPGLSFLFAGFLAFLAFLWKGPGILDKLVHHTMAESPKGTCSETGIDSSTRFTQPGPAARPVDSLPADG
jgi:hypothetical protein